jgi:uncharacterized glyoxalase superfamily protein PhnB
MKAPPKGWPRLSSSLFYRDPHAAITWLCRCFGFEVRLKVETDDGRIAHSELVFGDALVMVGSAEGDLDYQKKLRSPLDLGGNVTQTLALFVDDVDAHHAHAVASGVQLFRALSTNDYGDDYWADRSYGAVDVEGHLWFFMQRMRG